MWSRRDLELFGGDMVVGEGCGQGEILSCLVMIWW